MKLLLDTHAFLWFIAGDTRLSSRSRSLIEDLANERLLSVGSLWETAIKLSLGKLQLSDPIDQLVPVEMQKNSIDPLPITLAHLAAIVTLPHHHRDPFDRLLIAQATVENIPIISADPAFDAYPVTRLW